MGKKIMVLAGSQWQIPIVKKIQKMGHSALVVNPYPDSPAFSYGDGYALSDILDREACLAIAKEHKIDGILSEECDIAMPTVAYIADQLDLPSQGGEAVALFTNKFLMREFSKEHGLPCPAYGKCSTLDEALDFYRKQGGKLIMKPLDANSSRGVFTIRSEEDLVTQFPEAMAFSKVEKSVLLEEYLDGVEFTIDGIKTPDKHYTMAISQKKHYAHNENIACELYFSHENADFDYEALKAINDKYVEESGLPYGLTHAEYMWSNGRFYLIEIAARGGGNLISAEIVPVMTGIDNYEYLIESTLYGGQAREFTIPSHRKDRCAVLRFFDVPGSGIVDRIDGTDFLEQNPKVIRWAMNIAPGEQVEKAGDDSKRAGYYIAYGDTRQELDALMAQIAETVKIRLV